MEKKWVNSVTFYIATALKEVSKFVSNSYQVIKNDSSDGFLKTFPGEDRKLQLPKSDIIRVKIGTIKNKEHGQ